MAKTPDKKVHVKRKRVLADHFPAPKGKILLPPMVAKLGESLRPYSWTEHLPELLWVGLLVKKFGIKRSLKIAQDLVGQVDPSSKIPLDPKDAPFLVSEFDDIDPRKVEEITARLQKAGTLSDLRKALQPLGTLFPEFPMRRLLQESELLDQTASEQIVRTTVHEMYDNHGHSSMVVQAVALWSSVLAGRLPFPNSLKPDDFNEVVSRASPSQAQKAKSSIRMSLSSLFMIGAKARASAKSTSNWVQYFWSRALVVSKCSSRQEVAELERGDPKMAPKEGHDSSFERLSVIGKEYVDAISLGFSNAWQALDLSKLERMKFEVLSGLLARQVDLAMSVLMAPNHWGSLLGRIAVRSMADTCITLKWLCTKGKSADFERFIEYGLGQEKLVLEHVKQVNEKDGRLDQMIEMMQLWITAQKSTWLLPVNLGAWNPDNTRQMAEQCGLDDMYRLIYAPRSADVHGMWNSLSRLNLERCANAMHQFHHVPKPITWLTYIPFVHEVAIMMGEAVKSWCDAFGQTDFSLSPTKLLSDRLKNVQLNDEEE